MTGVSFAGSTQFIDMSSDRVVYGITGGSVSVGTGATLLFDDTASADELLYFVNSDVYLSGTGKMQGNANVPLYFGSTADGTESGNYVVSLKDTSTADFSGAQPAYLGYDAGYAVTLTVADQSVFSADDLYAGYSGSGVVNINDSGTLQADNLYLAANAGSSGELNLNGADLSGLQVDTVTGGNGTASVNFYNTEDTALQSNLAGTLSLNKYNDNTLTLSDGYTYGYTGSTSLYGGTLKTGKTDAIASSSNVYVAAGATLDLDGYDQKVNALSGAGNVLLGDRALTENNTSDTSTEFSGVISGTGSVTKTGAGTWTLTGENTYTGGTAVEAGILQLGNGGSTGSVEGNIVDNSALVINRNNEWDYTGIISGTGTVEQAGTGTTVLTGKNTYTGSTTVSAGTLKTGVADAFAGTSGVTVDSGATLNLGGNNQTVTSLTNGGTVLINDIGADVLVQAVTLAGDVTNSGTVVINNGSYNAGQTLVVDGDWTGEGGTVSIGTVLGDDDSLTDKLVVTGAATGTTYVSVTNEGGTGAKTLEGIEVIETGSSTANAFVQSGRIVAGSYEYHLQQGNASGANTNNWYLTSVYTGTDGGGTLTYRPERAAYSANLAAANTMFDMRLSDRRGNTYTDAQTGELRSTGAWVRIAGSHNKGRMSDGATDYSADRSVFQLGADVLAGSFTGKDNWTLGLTAGYGRQTSDADNRLSGYGARGKVWGYGAGIYGTWFQYAQEDKGLYADARMLYNRFSNSVKGDGLAEERYKSKGLTASLETGYTFDAGGFVTGKGTEGRFKIRPQAQITYSDVKADDHTESNGTLAEGLGNGNVQTRLGMRVSLKTGQAGATSSRGIEPYAEANWLHNSRQYGVRMNGENGYIEGSRNVGEVKAGVEGYLNPKLSIWADAGYRAGGSRYRDAQFTAGARYRF